MGLVLKTKNTVITATEKLYKDALVSNGTLLLHDYSNRGTLYNYQVKHGFPFRDLSDSKALGINNEPNYINAYVQENPLSKGFGVKMYGWGAATGSNLLGFNLKKDLLNYLASNATHEFIFSFWVRRNPAITGSGAFLTSTQTVSGNTTNVLRLNISSTGNITPTIAGATVTTDIDTSNGLLYNITAHYKGAGQKMSVYINGDYKRETAGNALGFGTNSSDLVIGFTGGSTPAALLYRIMIEDLTVSGRSASEVVSTDWAYCNGIEEFSGTDSKRPFINNI